ncbi:hypothetical protein ig2599ANME_1820 [groundwater metagenome]
MLTAKGAKIAKLRLIILRITLQLIFAYQITPHPPTPLSCTFLGAKGLSASLLTLPAAVHGFADPRLPSGLRSRQCCGCPGMPRTLRANRSPLVTGHVGWFVSYILMLFQLCEQEFVNSGDMNSLKNFSIISNT